MHAQTPTLAFRFHHTTPPAASLRLSATVRMDEAARLCIDYRLRGRAEALLMPSPAPARPADYLWQHTCFEAFVAVEGEVGYREFNFSPSGEWAMYAFSRYRSPLDPQPAGCADPGIVCGWDDKEFRLTARISPPDLPPHRHGQALTMGLCAVVEEVDGRLSYWAFRHHPERPDFHAHDAFALRLPAAMLRAGVQPEVIA